MSKLYEDLKEGLIEAKEHDKQMEKKFIIYWTERDGKVAFAMDTHHRAQLFTREEAVAFITQNKCNFMEVGVVNDQGR